MATMTPELRATIVQHQDAVRQVRAQVEQYARMAWGNMSSFRDADIDRVVDAVTPVALGGQQRIVALTDAYMAALATVSGYPQTPEGIPAAAATGAALRGVEPREVYRRAGVTVWTALAEQESLEAASRMGLRRLTSLLSTDLQLARTHAAQWRQSRDSTVVGYRRVLSSGRNCALCVIASTQRYNRGELMPIHPGCGCTVAEIRGSVDPGQVIDQQRLDELHESVRTQFGDWDPTGRVDMDYRQIMVRDHGEYGPTLTWRRHEFTGPADI